MASIEDIKTYRDELEAEFGVNSTLAYGSVSCTQLSIARHYGGAKIHGSYFVYNPTDDSLIRADVVKWIVNRKKRKG